MPRVAMQVNPTLLGAMFGLGQRRIVGVRGRYDPNDRWCIVFIIDAPDAPDGTVEMSPTYQLNTAAHMLDPGWGAE